ncbi:DUF3857 domain-containing protein [Phenylobacterium sp.]|uniref:DUF3857 domain-containing protein n=1 Tax=Phenylobacterium sp. TaxID=1871053 RepID=UPI00374D9657
MQFLLLDNQISLTREGSEVFSEIKVKPLTPDGLGAGNLSVAWDPQSESLTINRVTLTRAGQVTDILKSEQFEVLRRENNLEQATLDGQLTAVLQIKGVQVGDEIDFAFSKVHRAGLLQGRIQESQGLPVISVAGQVRLRTTWPTDQRLAWRATGDMPSLHPAQHGGTTELIYQADGLEPSVPTAGAPIRYNLRRLIEYSSFQNWGEVSAVMAPLFARAEILGPQSAVRAEAEKIRAQARDPVDRALLALRLVQDQVRYVYVGLNSAYVPATADETWTRRFGDCKAKTALLIALLEALDIPAEPVLVSTPYGDTLSGRLPRLGAFDHVLVRSVIAGQTYWLDGARIGDRSAETLTGLTYGWVLPVAADGRAELLHVTQAEPRKPLLETILTIDASKGLDTIAPIQLEEIYRGDSAIQLRRNLAAASPAEAKTQLINVDKESYPWVTFTDVTWKVDDLTGAVTLSAVGHGKPDWDAVKAGSRPNLRFFEIDNASFSAPDKYERPAGQDAAAPYLVDYPYFGVHVTRMTLPPGTTTYVIKGPDVRSAFGGYVHTRETQIQGSNVTMTRTVRAQTTEITASEASAAATAGKTLNTDPVYITAVPAVTPASAAANAGAGKGVSSLTRGGAHIQQGDYAGGLADADQALAEHADPGLAFALRAYALSGLHRYAEAATAFGEAAKATPPGSLLKGLQRGQVDVLVLGNRPAEAVTLLNTLITQDMGDPELRTRRSEAFAELNDDAKSLADADAAVRLAPLSSDSHQARGRILAKMNRFQEAAENLAEAARLAPESPENHNNLGAALIKLGRLEEARREFLESRRLDPTNSRAISGLFQAEFRLGHNAATLALLGEMQTKGPQTPEMLNAGCWNRAVAGLELERAAALCDAAIQAKPAELAFKDSRAFVSYRQGRFGDAVKRYDAILGQDPKFAGSLYGRGLAKKKLGDVAGGQADIAAARAISPTISESFAGSDLS